MKSYITSSLVAVVIVLGVIGLFAPQTRAAGISDLTGWAWSSNIGWVSFNGVQPAPTQQQAPQAHFIDKHSILAMLLPSIVHAQTTNFKVTVVANGTTGFLTGYAWSSNIGWIKFGGLATTPGFTSFPTDPNGVATDATVNLSTGAVTGWARACAGTVSGDCSNMTSRTDGWDGWIELSGTNHPTLPTGVAVAARGITYDNTTGSFNGKAWGGDVIGWLDFSAAAGVGGPGVVCATCGGGTGTPVTVSCTAPTTPVSFSSTGGTVTASASASGGSATGYQYTWSADGLNYGSYGGGPFGWTGWATPVNNGSSAMIYTLYVRARDSLGNLSAPAMCTGTITVNPPASQASALNLFIGSTQTTAGATHGVTYSVKKGGTFGLSWTNTLPVFDSGTGNGYKCISATSNNYATWSNQMTTAGIGATSGTDGMPTAGVTTGQYQLSISCRNWIGGTPSALPSDISQSIVNLKVTSVTQGEF